MFFVLSSAIEKFRFIKIGLAVLLIFIGCKMLLHDWLKDIGFKVGHSLLIILVILLVTILSSVAFPKKLTDQNSRIKEN
jgi:tellurite resistance protein TerC